MPIDLFESLFVFLREPRNPISGQPLLKNYDIDCCVYVGSVIQNMARVFIQEVLRGTPYRYMEYMVWNDQWVSLKYYFLWLLCCKIVIELTLSPTRCSGHITNELLNKTFKLWIVVYKTLVQKPPKIQFISGNSMFCCHEREETLLPSGWRWLSNVYFRITHYTRGRYSLDVWVGKCRVLVETSTLFQTN